ncbi:polysaccharide pyruvyl transferase CsaB [Thermosyntropha sp.]|uniref:polysaccharide pyruvyl transferase CsaB n=1 Tax=Thermosyntropha sp. TaxID=2740820 RepID=UPI0025EB7A04|nr:polysaccharide pyruvyl transferase CsaB [Thermosyntropha sp.]MBO8159733.1 polysaccharide pyruvyl transferase CsaB [Thermosyntropha sp.]
MRVVLSGYYGFDNAGDEALLSAITSSLKTRHPEIDFVVFSGNPQRTSLLHGISAVYYMNPFKVIKELKRADLLISGGGSIFQDVTSLRSFLYYLSIVALAKILGCPVMFYAQGIGPLNRKISRFMMRFIAEKVDIITLRDEESGRFLRSLGVKRDYKVTADPVFSLKPDVKIGEDLLFEIKDNVDMPVVGVSVRPWSDLAGYEKPLAEALDYLMEKGYKIVFMPLSYPEDAREARKIADLMNHRPYIIDRPLSSREHLALISRLHFVIGMRLHSLIFAAISRVPFAGISYDPKVEAFLKQFDLTPLNMKNPKIREELKSLLEDPTLRRKIDEKTEELTKKAEENVALALTLL